MSLRLSLFRALTDANLFSSIIKVSLAALLLCAHSRGVLADEPVDASRDAPVPNAGAAIDANTKGVMPVDLTGLAWHGRSGFDTGATATCPFAGDPSATNTANESKLRTIKIESFPVVLNNVFDTPTGSRLMQYTLCTTFELTAADLRRSPGIHLPWMGEGWQVYLNGQLSRNELYLNGENDGLAVRRIMRHQSLPLDAGALRVGPNVLTIRFAGYQAPTRIENNTNFGMLFANGYVVDEYAKLRREHSGHFRTMLTTVFLFFGLYHLLFFLYRRKDLYNLFFGLFTVCMGLDTFTGSGAAQELFLDTTWTNRVKYAAQGGAGGAMLLFLLTYFFRDRNIGRGGRIVLYGTGLLALGFLAAPFRFTEALLPLLHVSLLVAMVYGAYLMARVVYLRKEDALILSAGAAMLLGTSLWDVLGNYIYPLSFLLAPIGTLGCVLSLVFMLARRFLRVNNESERLNLTLTRQTNSFRRFVPVQFLDLLEKRDIVDVSLGDSSRRQVTVLFTDIRSFTGLSETMDADDNFRFLNSFLRRMEPCIQQNGGFVDKFIGDAIMALFPEDGSGASADAAVRTAILLQKEVTAFNEERRSRGYHPISVGIGINTGEVMLGTVGSRDRLDTTAIGNAVNLASRLESLTRHYECGILISEFSARWIPDMHAYHWREVDSVLPFGKREPVIIYEIFDSDPDELITAKDNAGSELLRAIVRYKSRDFQAALAIFQNLRNPLPRDRLIQIYVERCQQYIQEPPAADWAGVAALEHK